MSVRDIRAALAADSAAGAGNVLVKLIEHGASLDGPGITFDVPVDRHPAWAPLTLGALRDAVAARAAWLHAQGIRPRDPVAVYVSTSADCLLSFMALTWLGAIPALINGSIPHDIAVGYIDRLRATAVLADAAHRVPGFPILDVSQAGTGNPVSAPPHYQHHADDPVAITHSSGTTRIPAPVLHSHSSIFAAIRLVHLESPRADERTLCVFPAAHAAGIISTQLALCNRHEQLFLSGQGGPFPRSGPAVLGAIERWRPTGVYGFSVTWSELARSDLRQHDLSSVRLWFNTGDCAHETHIRRLVAAGSHLVYRRQGGVTLVPGSKFIDGIGSSEMGHSAFRIVHTSSSTRYGRCVGKPYQFADVRLLDPETGCDVPDGHVGHVALKSPTLAVGYWNDSVATWRTRHDGYYLTGDLMYRDDEGYYYHVDRAVDAVELGDGDWLYTAMAEERILVSCPDVRDCTVIAGKDADGMIVTDVLLQLFTEVDHPAGQIAGQIANRSADAGQTAGRDDAIRAALGERAAATLRRIAVVSDEDIVTGPTGKVRKFLMRQRYLAGVTS